LAYRNVLEVLACLAGGPEDIDAIDYSVMAQSDVLLDRVAPKELLWPTVRKIVRDWTSVCILVTAAR
jgi:hypothetical protein